MLSNLAMNLLQALGFGLELQQNGKRYVSIVRLNERLFLAIDPTEDMPASVRLVQVDLAVGAPAPAPVPGGQDGGQGPAPKATDETKKEETQADTPPDTPPVNPVS